MANFNALQIVGNVGKDPEVKYFESGKSMTTISLPVVAGWGDTKKTGWIIAKAFGKTGEIIAEYVTKGTLVMVAGQLELGSYETKEGEKKYTTTMVIEKVTLLGGKPSEEEKPKTKAKKKFVEEVDEDDIPF